jgi:hypothetical protein
MGIDLMLRGRSHPGWMGRGRIDLTVLAEWLRKECADEIESLDLDIKANSDGRDGEPRLLVWLHPAAESLEIVALPEGEIEISARTTPAGPGYHFYITRLLKKLGEEQRIDWLPPCEEEDTEASYDDTGFFFGAGAGEVYLHMDRWLATIAQLILERADDGDGSFSLGMPLQTGFTQLDFANTPLGPRSREWITQVAADVLEGDSRSASSFFPWPREGQDADYWFRRALVLMWTQAVWRPVTEDREVQFMRRIDNALTRAYLMDPGLAASVSDWPWREWQELRRFSGIESSLDGQINAEALRVPAHQPRLGYRRYEIVHRLLAGWSVRLPGEFVVYSDESGWHAQDRQRLVNISLFQCTDETGAPANRHFAYEGAEIPWTYVEESPSMSSRAHLREPTATDDQFHLHGLATVIGQFATVTITFTDPAHTTWAFSAWRSLRYKGPKD